MFADNYQELINDNSNFRAVLNTTERSQVVAMCLQVREEIGEEVHDENDQIFLITQGTAEVLIDGNTRTLTVGGFAVVPAGKSHNVTNAGDDLLKLMTIYSPAHHLEGTVHATKAEADAAEEAEA
jgi:mannose-6-phosphate isomerase-like protein (cupin superfamily)